MQFGFRLVSQVQKPVSMCSGDRTGRATGSGTRGWPGGGTDRTATAAVVLCVSKAKRFISRWARGDTDAIGTVAASPVALYRLSSVRIELD